MIARACWAIVVLGCSAPEAAPDGPVAFDGPIAADGAIPIDAPVEPDAACQVRSKLGPHLLGDPNDPGARTILSACPRVAKWLAAAGAADSIAQARASCPGLVVVLRVYVPP